MPTIVGNVYKNVNSNRYILVVGLSNDNASYGSIVSSDFRYQMLNHNISPYYFKDREKVVRHFILNDTNTGYMVLDMPNADFMTSGLGKSSYFMIKRRAHICNTTYKYIRHIKKEDLKLFCIKATMSLGKPLNIVDLDTLTKYIVDNMETKLTTSAKDYTNEYLHKNYKRSTRITHFIKQNVFILKRYKKNEVWFVASVNKEENTVLAYHLKDFTKKDFFEMLYYIDTLNKHEIYKKAATLECLDYNTLYGKALAKMYK